MEQMENRLCEGDGYMGKYTHVIWDFNGTILDDVEACIRSANLLLEAHGLPALPSREAYQRHFGFPLID